jgi:hypothetical protein
MWLPTVIVEDVQKVARISYIDVAHCKIWNEHRRPGELRLLTGWAWTAKDGSDARQGFKCMTIAYRDAWYTLVQQASIPAFIHRPRLRVVEKKAESARKKRAGKAAKQGPVVASLRSAAAA